MSQSKQKIQGKPNTKELDKKTQKNKTKSKLGFKYWTSKYWKNPNTGLSVVKYSDALKESCHLNTGLFSPVF